MDDLIVRRMAWRDIPELSRRIPEWKCIPTWSGIPATFFCQYKEFCLVAASGTSAPKAVIAGIPRSRPESTAFIHLLALAPPLIGSGIVRLLLSRFFSIAKEAGCERILAPVPVKSHTFISLFSLRGFDPTTPPGELKVGELSKNKEAEKSGTAEDPAFWWRDYFGPDDHGIVFELDI